MTSLPHLSSLPSDASNPSSPLTQALSILFEPSQILLNTLVPELSQRIKDLPPPSLESYAQLIDLALEQICHWDINAQAEFIGGHPRIGEVKGLSALSAKEQGQRGTEAEPRGTPQVQISLTPPEVLARLAHLNACYEARYPGLRYITFVNGRSRAVIAEEMEDVLGIDHSLSPDTPPVSTVMPYSQSDERWLSELKRAIEDVGKIAKSRLKILGVN